MIEPASAAAIVAAGAKAAEGAANESGKAVGSVLARALGPAADEIGEALRRFTAFRVGNVKAIDSAFDRKGGNERSGTIPPRVAHKLLEDGSFCDDEVMADYLGGVLAASRTPAGRDDRAVAWSNLVTGMSAIQVRTHYLLYREWAVRLHGAAHLNLAYTDGREAAKMFVDLTEFAAVLLGELRSDFLDQLTHCIPGLVRLGLLADEYRFGPFTDQPPVQGAEWPLKLMVMPSIAGMELYGWAQGLPGISANDFYRLALPFDVDPPVPGIHGVVIPGAGIGGAR